MSSDRRYPLGDYLTREEKEHLGVTQQRPIGLFFDATEPTQGIHPMAVKTGEHRAPREGEWFISGAIPTAHRASQDLSIEYDIAAIKLFEYVTTISVREVRR